MGEPSSNGGRWKADDDDDHDSQRDNEDHGTKVLEPQNV